MKRFIAFGLTFMILLGIFVMPVSAGYTDLAGSDNCLKIFFIGCSYGRDTMQDVGQILKALNVGDFLIGRFFHGSTPLEKHYEYATTNSDSYSYTETTPQYPTADYEINKVAGVKNVATALERHDWDIVIIQNTSGAMGTDPAYTDANGNSYAKLLGDFIKTKEPNAKLGYNMVWASPETSVSGSNVITVIKELHEGSSLKMQKHIVEQVKKYVYPYVKGQGEPDDDVFDFFIPSGTSIQNAEGLGISEQEMYRDHCHLNTGIGCYLAGLTVVSAILDDVTVTESMTAYPREKNETIQKNMDVIEEAVELALKSPFTTISTAKQIIENKDHNYRPAYLSGKSEAEFKSEFTKTINEIIADTGISVKEEDITFSDYKTDGNFNFSVKLSEDYSANDVKIVISDVFTIHPSLASGSKIDTVGKLDFTFNMDMEEDTLTNQNVILKEIIKNPAADAATYNERDYKSSYNAETKTFTINFEEGDIAPGAKYEVEFSTSVKSKENVTLDAPISFTYETKWGEYYINDNFSRYKKGDALGAKASDSTKLLPYQYGTQSYAGAGMKYAQIIEENGRKVMWARAVRTNEAKETGYIWGYRHDYLPEVRTNFTEHEVEFKFSGDDDGVYAVWSTAFTVRKMTDGKFYLCASLNGQNLCTNGIGFDTTPATPLFEVKEDEINKIKFVVYRDKNTSGVRTRYLYKIYKEVTNENNEKEFEEVTKIVDTMGKPATDTESEVVTTMKDFKEPIRLSNYSGSYLDYSASATSGHHTFGVYSPAKQSAPCELFIYSFKYKPYSPVKSTYPMHTQKDVKIDANAEIYFNLPVVNTNLEEIITVVDDGGKNIEYKGTLSEDKLTYVIDFEETPLYKAYYKVQIPDTLKTTFNYTLDKSVEFQFQFEDRMTTVEDVSTDVTGNKLTKNIKIKNANPGEIVLAVYSNNKLVGFDFSYITEIKNTEDTETLSVTADEIANTDNKITYKVMYFKELSKLALYKELITGEIKK